MIVHTIKLLLVPGTVVTILALFGSGVALLYVRPRWGRAWLTLLVLALWIASSPIGANSLAWSLGTRYTPLGSADEARGANAIVMLGGGTTNIRSGGRQLSYPRGNSPLRLIETARVYHLLGDPLVIVSGGVTDELAGAPPEADAYRAGMIALGVPAARIVTESESHNTYEEAIILRRMLGERGIDRFVLVTSRLHMPRSIATFEARGLHPIPSPPPLYADRLTEPFPLLPNDISLEVSHYVMYEWLARTYYWMRGFTRPAAAE